MQTSLFSFDLPEDLIASVPAVERGSSRLMLLDRMGPSEPGHHRVTDLPDLIEEGTLMVFNDTRVRKARIFAVNESTGSKGEFLFLRSLSDAGAGKEVFWECIVDKAKRKRLGDLWLFPGDLRGRIADAPSGDRRIVCFDSPPDEAWFEQFGHVPLPPYIRRADVPMDAERYQTVYARETGSAAAPTAGLHFTTEILERLEKKGVETAWVTLEVGLGTFAPVRSELIEDHPMHRERYFVPEQTALQVADARSAGRPVLAVGTTAVRTLESSWNGEELKTGWDSTDLFIYPGYRFSVVDRLFTNFHTPRSTLLMLVSAFCGRERLLAAYETAVRECYRFFSYGDAMLIL